MLTVELAMSESAGGENFDRGNEFIMSFRTSAYQLSMPHLHILPMAVRLKVIGAYDRIDQFNSLVGRPVLKHKQLEVALTAIKDVRQIFAEEMLFDTELD